MTKYLPAGLMQYVLPDYSAKVSSYYVTSEDVSEQLQRLELDNFTGQQLVRGRGGRISVTYEVIGMAFSAHLGNANPIFGVTA